MTEVNEEKLGQFVGQMLNDLGGALSIPLVRIGDNLGLYKAMAEHGPMTSQELADKAGCAERYLREWLSAHAAANYVTYDGASEKFTLPPEQQQVFLNENSPMYMMAAYDLAVAMINDQERFENAFKTGEGVPWNKHSACFFSSVARFFKPTYVNCILQEWLPALDSVVDKLTSGAKVADVGCGHAVATILMAKAFPSSEFVGFDFHDESVATATKNAADAGISNIRFEQAIAKGYPGNDYDLITFFDCLHDMGDPAGAAAHVKQSLKPDGTWMIVEPIAGDKLEDNLNPVGRLYYQGSTMGCVGTSLAQEVGAALGAQAGEKRLSEMVKAGGFSKVRRATETGFNMVLEARP